MKFYLDFKKIENTTVPGNWLEVENIRLGDLTQILKDKHHMASLICEL